MLICYTYMFIYDKITSSHRDYYEYTYLIIAPSKNADTYKKIYFSHVSAYGYCIQVKMINITT